MDRAGLTEARDALMQTGWFSEIKQVKRSGMSEVSVDGVWTIPFAVVREGGYDHLIDIDINQQNFDPADFVDVNETVPVPHEDMFGFDENLINDVNEDAAESETLINETGRWMHNLQEAFRQSRGLLSILFQPILIGPL
jgi:hypothetical protein